MNRKENLMGIESEIFDICIIGAGASGAGCALDAALRGYRVLLVEKTDFAAETSSKSTKLIHGGVRYLEQAFKKLDFAQLTQVRHGLEERHRLLTNAPHLARPLALVTPVFSWFEGLYFTIGLKVYGFFAKNDTLPKAEWLSKQATLAAIPNVTKRLHSAVKYYDGQLDDARYCVALAQSAAAAGAVVVNHCSVVDFPQDTGGGASLSAATLRDELSGKKYTATARLFLNCTGAAADSIRLMANPTLKPRIRPSKGVHLVLPADALKSRDYALMIPKTRDGRLIFVIPFDDSVMVGTTDDDYKDIDVEPTLNDAEIDFILETLAPYFDKTPQRSEILAGFGGLRPLIVADRADTKSLVRDHEVEHDKTSNLLSLLGGKWTTYRLMAKDAIDAAERILSPQKKELDCKTANHALFGGENQTKESLDILSKKITKNWNLDPKTVVHLVEKYGQFAEKVLETSQTKGFEAFDLLEKLTPQYPHLRAEVLYTAQQEMAMTVRDFLARRSRIELMNWQLASELAPIVAQIMGKAHDWSAAEIEQSAADYQRLIRQFRRATQPPVLASDTGGGQIQAV